MAKRWPEVQHISQNDFIRLAQGGNAVLFDVRSPEEYAVSHIKGAIQVTPEISADDFLAKYGAALKGKSAVFYCSIGVRSSKLTARVAGGLKAAGASGAGSLKGGIFAWANAARPVVDANGPADKVHGFEKGAGKPAVKP